MRRRVELVLEVDGDLPEMIDAAFALLIESLAVAGIERGPFKVLAIVRCRVRPSRFS
jgi:hypothetical protein